MNGGTRSETQVVRWCGLPLWSLLLAACGDQAPQPSPYMGTWVGPVRETPAYEEYPVELRQYWADTIQLDDRGLYWFRAIHAIVSVLGEPREMAFGYDPVIDVCPVREGDRTWYVEADTLFFKTSVLAHGVGYALIVNDTLLMHLVGDRPFVLVTRDTPNLPEEHVDWCVDPEDGP